MNTVPIKQNNLRIILLSGLLVGTLDITAACTRVRAWYDRLIARLKELGVSDPAKTALEASK